MVDYIIIALISFNSISGISVICLLDVLGQEDHPVVKFLDTSLRKTRDTIHGPHITMLESVNALRKLWSLSWSKECDDIWYHDKCASENAGVAWFGLIDHWISQNNIDTSWHSTSGYLRSILLDPQLLPIAEYWVLFQKMEDTVVTAIRISTNFWLGESELLLYSPYNGITHTTLKDTCVQFWSHLSWAGDCSRNGIKFSNHVSF